MPARWPTGLSSARRRGRRKPRSTISGCWKRCRFRFSKSTPHHARSKPTPAGRWPISSTVARLRRWRSTACARRMCLKWRCSAPLPTLNIWGATRLSTSSSRNMNGAATHRPTQRSRSSSTRGNTLPTASLSQDATPSRLLEVHHTAEHRRITASNTPKWIWSAPTESHGN